MFGKRKVATLVAEFLGTGILTLLVLSVQRSTIGVPFFVAIAAGLTIILMTFAFGNLSGGHFNPAITIAMWTARKVSTVSAVLYVAMQLLGAWGAYFLYRYFVNTALQPIGGHFTGRIMLAEAVGTAIFAFGWAASVYQSFPRAVSAAVTGIAYMLGIIAASAAAIGLANPALALGVRAWVWGTYVLGPVVGAVIAVNLYGLLFASPESLVASSGVTAAAVVTEVVTIEPANARKSRPARTTKAKSVAKKKTTTRRTTRK